jgi:hypothetical protein
LHDDSIDYIVNKWIPLARRNLPENVEFIDPQEYHVTSVYSRSGFYFVPCFKTDIEAFFTGWRLLGPLDNQTTLVALLSSPFLMQLFVSRYFNGADWKFKKYIPHVSLVKNVPRGAINNIPPLQRKIILSEEYVTALDEDFNYAVKAVNYYNEKTFINRGKYVF